MSVVPLTTLLDTAARVVADAADSDPLQLPSLSALSRHVLRADVVYDGLGTPRENGVVTVQRSALGSSLVSVASAGRAQGGGSDQESIDAGFAITPLPVNAHTHLDLSDMPFTPGGYVSFIEAVIAHNRSGARGLPAARRGVAALVEAGTTIIGDIVTRPDVMDHLLRQDDVSGVAYWEVLGPDPALADEVFDATRAAVNGFRERQRPGGMRVGVSPHTPHTVSGRLLTLLAGWAKAERLPLAIHVAESPDETRLHLRGDGPIAESFRAFGVPFQPSGVSPVAYLDRLDVLSASPTLIHMVNVDEDDVRAVQRHGCTVVHCPRSNEALGCGRFPWELYAKHGVDVAFGTDSTGSSPDLDVTEDVRASELLHGAKANVRGLVRAAVKGGYRALRMEPPRVTRGDPIAGLYAWQRRVDVSSKRHAATTATS